MAMFLKESKESLMSPVERYMWAPAERIHFSTESEPQLQAEKRISRPEALRAMPILL